MEGCYVGLKTAAAALHNSALAATGSRGNWGRAEPPLTVWHLWQCGDAAMTINTIYGEIVLIYEYSMEEF